MPLICYFVDPGEASAARQKLQQAGIEAEVKAVDPHIMKPSKSGTERIGLWVQSADQVDDAVRCLKNKG